MSPADAASLLSALQGAGGAGGGLAGLLGTPSGMTGNILQSIVDRLPIEKMFDGTAFMPQIDQDALLARLPLDSLFPVGSAMSVVGALTLPGRSQLEPLEGVGVEIVDRVTTRLDDGQESWIFLADRPAVVRLEVRAGPQGLDNAFLDVRVSRDGTAASGIKRSAFRLQPFTPNERRVVPVELPPDLLAQAPKDGDETCVSIRVIERSDDKYRGIETRACFYVVQPSSVVIDPQETRREAPELDDLPGLAETLPKSTLSPQLRAIHWKVDVLPSTELAANGRYRAVHLRVAGEEALAEGGLSLSSLGIGDLARRALNNDLGAEGLTALTAAIDSSSALRERMSLEQREPTDPGMMARADKGLTTRLRMSWLSAFLVTFQAPGPDGNPVRREVSRISLPVPDDVVVQPV